jgi:hypothetical protein
VGVTGGVEEVINLWRSLISSRAVSVYRGADLTILRATWRFNLSVKARKVGRLKINDREIRGTLWRGRRREVQR